MTTIEILKDQLVLRNKDEHGNRINEMDVWFEGNYLGTIQKIGLSYWSDVTTTPLAHFSLIAALNTYVTMAETVKPTDAVLNVPMEQPEQTIWNFVKEKFNVL